MSDSPFLFVRAYFVGCRMYMFEACRWADLHRCRYVSIVFEREDSDSAIYDNKIFVLISL